MLFANPSQTPGSLTGMFRPTLIRRYRTVAQDIFKQAAGGTIAFGVPNSDFAPELASGLWFDSAQRPLLAGRYHISPSFLIMWTLDREHIFLPDSHFGGCVK